MPCPDCGNEEYEEEEGKLKCTDCMYVGIGSDFLSVQKKERPEVPQGLTEKINSPKGTMYVTVNTDSDGNPFEMFAQVGKAGGSDQAMTEAIARLASLAFRSGIEYNEVMEQLEGIRGPKPSWDNGKQIKSVPDAIATVMEKRLD